MAILKSELYAVISKRNQKSEQNILKKNDKSKRTLLTPFMKTRS
ncbi:hypothetical protein [Listeria monocytogenes]|nr:hypothetical protein [Listeria monocytogenes]